MDWILCWHRGRKRGLGMVCQHCGVSLEGCPCACYRNPDQNCPACNGSGFVAIVRWQLSKFSEYVERDADPVEVQLQELEW